MANSQLLGKEFTIPDKLYRQLGVYLKKHSNQQDSKGYKRANTLLRNGKCTYEVLKRIKNYFDHLDPNNIDQVEYELNGGDEMREWVNWKLEMIRKALEGGKKAKTQGGMSNQYRQEDGVDVNNMNLQAGEVQTAPDLMSTNELMEQVDRIKQLINKK